MRFGDFKNEESPASVHRGRVEKKRKKSKLHQGGQKLRAPAPRQAAPSAEEGGVCHYNPRAVLTGKEKKKKEVTKSELWLKK